MMIRGDLDRRYAVLYMLVQIVGGCLGVLFAHLMFGLDPIQLATKARTGLPQWFAEFVATFGLLITTLGCVRFRPDAVAFDVGLYITSAYWFTASISFANPAVTIGRSLSDTFAGLAPADVPASSWRRSWELWQRRRSAIGCSRESGSPEKRRAARRRLTPTSRLSLKRPIR
jgi:glycerol uptake facilitator-like aquaporin